MGRVDGLLMPRTHRVLAYIADGISSAGNAGAPRSKR